MIRLVKIQENETYFLDHDGNPFYKYDPNIECTLTITLPNGSLLSVMGDNIKQMYGGQIYFDYNEDRFIIDDGYSNLVTRAGYIVLNDYNDIHEDDKSKGINLRGRLMSYSAEVFKMWDDKDIKIDSISTTPQEITVKFQKSHFEFTITIDTINSIVAKNQKRKLNNLPYYPFAKNMDKFGTLYMTIFCQRLEGTPTENVTEKYNIAEKFIMKYIDLLNEYSQNNDKYHFDKIIVKKKICYCEGI